MTVLFQSQPYTLGSQLGKYYVWIYDASGYRLVLLGDISALPP